MEAHNNPGNRLVLVNTRHLRVAAVNSVFPADHQAHTTVAFGLRPAADGPPEIALDLPEVRGCAQMQWCCAVRCNTHQRTNWLHAMFKDQAGALTKQAAYAPLPAASQVMF